VTFFFFMWTVPVTGACSNMHYLLRAIKSHIKFPQDLFTAGFIRVLYVWVRVWVCVCVVIVHMYLKVEWECMIVTF